MSEEKLLDTLITILGEVKQLNGMKMAYVQRISELIAANEHSRQEINALQIKLNKEIKARTEADYTLEAINNILNPSKEESNYDN